ncbi:glycosyltransferase family 39 protein [Leptolyngbya sp. NIES-2104]|uniref:glycosyltransferase family 39 protein n=1 Tax=Leptolyngbya sp. NIES-2104 TaxID=1552121 RepID=UPI0006EC8A9B|nr:glycosyltransferase family 39 protein [Leptolyngbya sp. NIES-2104]GAP93821.1 hypothetical protein NIES2104_03300 [Leptolyngbya sp. NIES-2104]
MERVVASWRNTPLSRWLSIGIISTLGVLLGLSIFALIYTPVHLESVQWSPEAQWVSASQPSYKIYLRRTEKLNYAPEAAWLKISADSDFIVYVNGQAVLRETNLLNQSRGLGLQLSDRFQRLSDSRSYDFRHRPAYWYGGSPDWKLTAYLELTRYLRAGKNVIAIVVENPRRSPRVVIEGVIYPSRKLSSAIHLTTGETPWLVSTLPKNRQGIFWYDSELPDEDWETAKALGTVQEKTYSRLTDTIFDRLLSGAWITGQESQNGELWLRREWNISEQPHRAFVRFAANGRYSLMINHRMVRRVGVVNSHQVRIHEVTEFLKPGRNIVAVRASRPIAQEAISTDPSPLSFFLDGWVEKAHGLSLSQANPLRSSSEAFASDTAAPGENELEVDSPQSLDQDETQPLNEETELEESPIETTPDDADAENDEQRTDLALRSAASPPTPDRDPRIVSPIVTDENWQVSDRAIPGWFEGAGAGNTARVVGLPNPSRVQRRYEGNADLYDYPRYLGYRSLLQAAGVGFALFWAWMLGRFRLKQKQSNWDYLIVGAGLLLPGTVFLATVGLLKHRFTEVERGLFFIQPQSLPLTLLGFVGIVGLTFVWNRRSNSRPEEPRSIVYGSHFGGFNLETLPRWESRPKLKFASSTVWQSVLFILIFGFAFVLRLYDLDFQALDTDEGVSLDAIRGILRTGVPIATSGIWYSRGPFYHYAVALWLSLFGDSATNARLLSVFLGQATLIAVFLLARKVTGKVWIALVVVAILAVDPMEIWYSRNIRFYQLTQLLDVIVFGAFIKGFIDRSGRWYQYLFFVALTLMLISQEVTVVLLPCFFLGFWYFYRPFRLSEDWRIVVGSVMAMGIYVFNGIFFIIKCLTPWVVLASTTDSYLKPHLWQVTAFVNCLFVGPTRMYTLYGFFFLLGFVYTIWRRDGKLFFLFSNVLLSVLFLTLLLYQVAIRYVYTFYPIFIILAVYSAIVVMQALGSHYERVLGGQLPLRKLATGFVVLLLFLNLEVDRVFAGYQDMVTRRSTDAFEYIRDHRQPGDLIIAHTPSVATGISGAVDYVLPSNWAIPFDSVYLREGQVVDRAGGGQLLSNLDQMSHILEGTNRIWIQLDEERELRNDPNFIQFFQTLGEPVLETFGSRLRLWERKEGVLPRVPNQGRDLGVP